MAFTVRDIDQATLRKFDAVASLKGKSRVEYIRDFIKREAEKMNTQTNEVTVILSRQDLAEFLDDNAAWMDQYRAELERRLSGIGYAASVEVSRDALADKVLADDEDQAKAAVTDLMADMGNDMDGWLKQ